MSRGGDERLLIYRKHTECLERIDAADAQLQPGAGTGEGLTPLYFGKWTHWGMKYLQSSLFSFFFLPIKF